MMTESRSIIKLIHPHFQNFFGGIQQLHGGSLLNLTGFFNGCKWYYLVLPPRCHFKKLLRDRVTVSCVWSRELPTTSRSPSLANRWPIWSLTRWALLWHGMSCPHPHETTKEPHQSRKKPNKFKRRFVCWGHISKVTHGNPKRDSWKKYLLCSAFVYVLRSV